MHPIRCECGAIRGQIEGTGAHNRLICHCADCRAFARFLGKAGDVLDGQGGTEIVHVAQWRLRFLQGEDRLAVLRLSDKGMLRWYAACCGTPIGNTLANPKISFIGLIHTCLERSRMDGDFGTRLVVLNMATAQGAPARGRRGLLGFAARLMWIIVTSRIRRGRGQSPLFTDAGSPRATPRILTAAEVADLKNCAWPGVAAADPPPATERKPG